MALKLAVTSVGVKARLYILSAAILPSNAPHEVVTAGPM